MTDPDQPDIATMAERLAVKYGTPESLARKAAREEAKAARQRFTERTGQHLDALRFIDHVSLDHHSTRPIERPTLDLYVDALYQFGEARRMIDYDEQTIIEAARRRGATWDRIGAALGHPPESARQAALRRWRRLAGPGVTPPVPESNGDPT